VEEDLHNQQEMRRATLLEEAKARRRLLRTHAQQLRRANRTYEKQKTDSRKHAIQTRQLRATVSVQKSESLMQQIRADEVTPNVSTILEQNKQHKRSMRLDAFKHKTCYKPALFPKEYLTDFNETPPFYLELDMPKFSILSASLPWL
jgi:hypothetical protein